MLESVTISSAEYLELNEAAQKLSALEAAGVDNWEGYDTAMEILAEWEDDNSELEDGEG